MLCSRSFYQSLPCEHCPSEHLNPFVFLSSPKQGYRPGKAGYEDVARAASEAGDAEASAQFLEAADILPAANEEDAAVESAEGGREQGVDGGGDVGSASGDGRGEDGTAGQERARSTCRFMTLRKK